MSTPFTILVSGANRGIGHAICSSLLSSRNPIVLYAASRQGNAIGLSQPSGSKVIYPRLDITDERSVQALVKRVKEEQGGLDVLINNAGINLDVKSYNPTNARRVLDTNYRGTLRMCEAFLPIIKPNGRIVNLSSLASRTNIYSDVIKSRFHASDLTLEQLEGLAREFEAAASSTTERAAGFSGPGRAYNVSKSCINAMTRILARENEGVKINACCPGWVSSAMGNLLGKPPKTLEDGARIPVRLAIGEIGDVTGAYWANESMSGKGDGKVIQDW